MTKLFPPLAHGSLYGYFDHAAGDASPQGAHPAACVQISFPCAQIQFSAGKDKRAHGNSKGILLAVRWVPHASKGAGDSSQAGQSLKNKHVKQMQQEEI